MPVRSDAPSGPVTKPAIQFPCNDYPVKVMGRAEHGFCDLVLGIIRRHDPGHDGSAEVRSSNRGTFVSVTVRITATGPEQLQALHLDLKATGRVTMVL